MTKLLPSITLVATLPLTLCASSEEEWAPVEGHLMTRWAEDVSPENALPEYPRPQMVREDWQNLNGLWDYAILPKDAPGPEAFEGKILVPFAIESSLSGVKKTVGEENRLWYRRTFEVPDEWLAERMLLHFGAVDWDATVWVNGKRVGRHKGGYDAFSFDITDALKPGGGPQEIVVSVWDPTDKGYQPRGKQVTEPKGIWYTAVTGIWQTVWVEPIPEEVSVQGVKIVPDIDAETVRLTVNARGATDDVAVVARVLDGTTVVKTEKGTVGTELAIKLYKPKLWSPDSPTLYGLQVLLEREGEQVDEVSSYFGMRKVSLAKDDQGVNRLFLNNEPLFHFGPLDQGWWPDGLYTAATEEALRYDVEITRRLGYNMARKHVKVEPARWYYYCDLMGLMVWQDMPSGDAYIRGDDPDITRSPESREGFYREWQAIIDTFHNHPCIVMWVPFNEGWGQFETNEVTAWTKNYDPTRLVNQASGWTDRQGGDVHDMHRYPGPDMPPIEENRAAVLGEFGGLGLPVEGHLWWNKRNWGYRTYKEVGELRDNYENLIVQLRPLIGKGLAAAVYTQTSDVEGEVNGLLTYDRDRVKLDEDWLAELNAKVYLPAPVMRTIVADSKETPQTWRYTSEKPAEGWESETFDDSGWKEGPGVFGTEGTPGAEVRTKWDTKHIWIRRSFELADAPEGTLLLWVLHDEGCQIYVNGVFAAKTHGHTGNYLAVALSPEAQGALRPGRNTLAVHCEQTGGGQSIDVGLILIEEQEAGDNSKS